MMSPDNTSPAGWQPLAGGRAPVVYTQPAKIFVAFGMSFAPGGMAVVELPVLQGGERCVKELRRN
jgi:hypothetical protein